MALAGRQWLPGSRQHRRHRSGCLVAAIWLMSKALRMQQQVQPIAKHEVSDCLSRKFRSRA
jgi:hypothetical protein